MQSNTKSANRQKSLTEILFQIDPIQARRFVKLDSALLEIAREGIVRHLKACARADVRPDASAVREIIDDALDGRRVYATVNEDRLGVAA